MTSTPEKSAGDETDDNSYKTPYKSVTSRIYYAHRGAVGNDLLPQICSILGFDAQRWVNASSRGVKYTMQVADECVDVTGNVNQLMKLLAARERRIALRAQRKALVSLQSDGEIDLEWHKHEDADSERLNAQECGEQMVAEAVSSYITDRLATIDNELNTLKEGQDAPA